MRARLTRAQRGRIAVADCSPAEESCGFEQQHQKHGHRDLFGSAIVDRLADGANRLREALDRMMARHVTGWLNDEASRQRLISRLMALREQVAAGGASATAAEYIVRELGARQVTPLRKAS